MALNFPNSPQTNDTVSFNGKVYKWDGEKWISLTPLTSSTTSDTAPLTPAVGDLWFNSTNLTLYIYYDDGDSQQWVNAAGGIVVESIQNIDGGSASSTFAAASDTILDGGNA